MPTDTAAAAFPGDLDEREFDQAQVDQEDLARFLVSLRGVPSSTVSTMHYVQRSDDGLAPAYAFDEDTGMVYILD